jgi:hypothetical protein
VPDFIRMLELEAITPSAPPAENPDRMGLFCASGTSLNSISSVKGRHFTTLNRYGYLFATRSSPALLNPCRIKSTMASQIHATQITQTPINALSPSLAPRKTFQLTRTHSRPAHFCKTSMVSAINSLTGIVSNGRNSEPQACVDLQRTA